MAEVFLAPTTIYVEAVRPLLRDMNIKGMAHITGGGFYDNIPRILPAQVEARIRFGSWQMPPVFTWLKEAGGLDWPEMLQIFNCGIGFVIILPQAQAEEAVSRIRAYLPAWQIGEIARRSRGTEGEEGEQVVVEFEGDTDARA